RFVLAASLATLLTSAAAGLAGSLAEQPTLADPDITGALPSGAGPTASNRLHREIRESLDRQIRIEGLLGDLTRDLLDNLPRVGDKLPANATLDELPAGLPQMAQQLGYSEINKWTFVASDLQGDFVLVDARRIVVAVVRAPTR